MKVLHEKLVKRHFPEMNRHEVSNPIPLHPIPFHPLDEKVTHVHLSHIQRWLSCLWYCVRNLFTINFKVSKNPFKKQTNKTNWPKPKTKQKTETPQQREQTCLQMAAGQWLLQDISHQSRNSKLCLLNAASCEFFKHSWRWLWDDFSYLFFFFPQNLWKFPLHKPIEILLKNGYAKNIWKMVNHHCISLLDLSSLPDTYSLCIWRFFSILHTLVLNSAFKQKFEQQLRK